MYSITSQLCGLANTVLEHIDVPELSFKVFVNKLSKALYIVLDKSLHTHN